MCVILEKPVGQTISKELVAELWDRNKDGAGFLARSKDGEWMTRKGLMDKDEFLESVSKYFGEDSELVCHMRIKTTGQITTEHTHPFVWTKVGPKSQPRYLFHNGTVKFLKPSGDSDSMMLAKMLQNLETEEAHLVLKDLASHGAGRFVTLANNKITIFGDDESVTDNGIWFSNGRHLAAKKTNTVTVYTPQQHGHYGDARTTPLPAPKVVLPISDSPSRTKNIKTIATFYALRRQVLPNEQFIASWADENGIDMFPDATLEQIAKFSEINQNEDKVTDPMYEFLLTFAQ